MNALCYYLHQLIHKYATCDYKERRFNGMYIDDMDGMEQWSIHEDERGAGVGIMLGPTEETCAFCLT